MTLVLFFGLAMLLLCKKACVPRRIHSEKTKNDYTSQETELIIISNVSGAIQLPSSVNMSRKLRETTRYTTIDVM